MAARNELLTCGTAHQHFVNPGLYTRYTKTTVAGMDHRALDNEWCAQISAGRGRFNGELRTEWVPRRNLNAGRNYGNGASKVALRNVTMV